jgi:hypothetical protein
VSQHSDREADLRKRVEAYDAADEAIDAIRQVLQRQLRLDRDGKPVKR